MNGLVVNFVRGAATAHVALLFYAGHGMQIDGKNYLLPVDAKFDGAFDLTKEAIDMDTILAGLDDRIRANILILDACRDNPLLQKDAQLAAGRSVAVSSVLRPLPASAPEPPRGRARCWYCDLARKSRARRRRRA